MNNVLWIGEQFCDANPQMGETNSLHNFVSTFIKAFPDKNLHTLFIDDGNIAEKIAMAIDELRPIAAFITLLGDSPLNPTIDCLENLTRLGVKTCIIWPDTGPGWGIETIKSIGNKINLHVSIDYPVGNHINHYVELPNHIFLYTPQDIELYYPDTKIIDVSFAGSKRYYDRIKYITYLHENHSNLIISGGQRENKLSYYEYAKLIRTSKIGINFSLSPTTLFHQLKGRVLECVASKTLLLEYENPATRQFFKPGIEYIEFSSPQDLSFKINYYLNNEEERLKIAENGYNTYISNYTSNHFWHTIWQQLSLPL